MPNTRYTLVACSVVCALVGGCGSSHSTSGVSASSAPAASGSQSATTAASGSTAAATSGTRTSSSPGVLSEQTHLYLAEGLTAGPMGLEKDEDLEPQVLAWDQVVDWADSGVLRDAKTLVEIGRAHV